LLTLISFKSNFYKENTIWKLQKFIYVGVKAMPIISVIKETIKHIYIAKTIIIPPNGRKILSQSINLFSQFISDSPKIFLKCI